MREQIAEEKALEQSIQDDDPCLQRVRTILDAGYKPGGGSWEGQKARAAALRALLEKVAQAAIDASAEVAEAVESPFHSKHEAPQNCAFYDGTEMAERAIRALSPKAIVEGVK